MYILKGKGHKIDPCGTPIKKIEIRAIKGTIFVLNFLTFRKLLISYSELAIIKTIFASKRS